jgi:hypothetical protein
MIRGAHIFIKFGGKYMHSDYHNWGSFFGEPKAQWQQSYYLANGCSQILSSYTCKSYKVTVLLKLPVPDGGFIILGGTAGSISAR